MFGPFIHLESVDSTNTEIRRRLDLGEGVGLCVVSREQTAGRGQLGRVWHSPKGSSLYASFSFSHSAPPHQISFAAGLATARTLRSACAVEACVRWPNDILVNGKKIAGNLVEGGGKEGVYILGCGLNVNTEEFPPELAAKATSARIENGFNYPLESVEKTLLKELEAALNTLSQSWYRLLQQWREYDCTPGSLVRVADESGERQVTAEGVDDTGCLITESGDRLISSSLIDWS